MGYKVAWQAVLEKYDYRCYYCGVQSLNLIREHKIPSARGGRTSRENLVPACTSCNVRKGTSTAEEFVAVVDMQARARRWQETPLTYEELVARDGAPKVVSAPQQADSTDGTDDDDADRRYVAHSRLIAYAPKCVLTSARLSPGAKLFYLLVTMGEHPMDESINDKDANDRLSFAAMKRALWCTNEEHDAMLAELVAVKLAEPDGPHTFSLKRPAEFYDEEYPEA